MLVFSQELLDGIVSHAYAGLPFEACGLLSGKRETVGGKTVISVTGVHELTNIDQSAEHFSMDPGEQFKVISKLRKTDSVLLGNFHSHPVTPARPSPEDIRLAYDPNLVYIIVSLAKSEPVIKAFHIENETYQEIPIKIK